MKPTKLITLSALMIVLLNSCYKKKYEKCKNELTLCENINCSPVNTNKDLSLNLDLRYDCSKRNHYQPMHLDIKNRFGIFAKMHIDTIAGTIDSISLKIKNANCKKLYINKVTLMKKREDRKFHDLKVEIDTIKQERIKIPYVLNLNKTEFNLNDIFDIHINPKGGIYGTATDLKEIDGFLTVNETLTTFGTEFCKTIMVETGN